METIEDRTRYTKRNVYFAGRLIIAEGRRVMTDRLGSVRGDTTGARYDYYPYGEERTSTPDNVTKFATYFRDGPGGDYADQRYYMNTAGRFMTPDPYQASGGPADPGSWNRYAYVQGDPVNANDPAGLRLNFVECGAAGDPYGGVGAGGCGGGGWGHFTAFPTFIRDSEGTPIGGMLTYVWIPDMYSSGGDGSSAELLADQSLRAARDRAVAALQSDNCRNLFGNDETRGSGFDPIQVLDDIVQESLSGGRSPYANIRWETGSGVSVSADRTISIGVDNWNGWGASSLGAEHNAHTLLHELGHVYDLLSGSGNSVIKSPDALPKFVPILGGDKRSKWNDWKVDQDCFGGVLGYQKP